MNEEVTKIIKHFKRLSDRYIFCKDMNSPFNDNEYQAYIILNYITNLQKENRLLKIQVSASEEVCRELEEKIEETNDILQNENQKLKEQLNQYENPDDMTLFYMWLDEKAKDKMKQLESENQKLREANFEHQKLNGQLREDLIVMNNKNMELVKVIDGIEKYVNDNKVKLPQGRNDFTCKIIYSDFVIKVEDILNKLNELKGGKDD